MFYCHNCKTFEPNSDYDFRKHDEVHTWANVRDGFGRPINHIICPICGDPLSGFINTKGMSDENIEYYKDVLMMYQVESGGFLFFKEGDKFETIEDLKKDMIDKVAERVRYKMEIIKEYEKVMKS